MKGLVSSALVFARRQRSAARGNERILKSSRAEDGVKNGRTFFRDHAMERDNDFRKYARVSVRCVAFILNCVNLLAALNWRFLSIKQSDAEAIPHVMREEEQTRSQRRPFVHEGDVTEKDPSNKRIFR